MSNSQANIFAQTYPEEGSRFKELAPKLQELGIIVIKKAKQLFDSVIGGQENKKKVVQNVLKGKQFLKENKELILGVGIVAVLFIINQRRAQKNKNSKSRHIHSLTSNPNSPLKRSGSGRKDEPNGQVNGQLKSSPEKKPKKSPALKLAYLKPFISEGEEEDYIRSDEEDKSNPDLSASTRRTESMVSDMEQVRKKKKRNLQPIMDLVQQEEQTQDRVFFEMFRTYRES